MIYEPHEDSFFLLSFLKEYCKGKVLDMGTGSGILAFGALKFGCIVTAIDINSEAAQNFISTPIKFIQSDLFKRVKGKFDVIIFNPPYLPVDPKEQRDSRLHTTGGKHGYEILEKFFSQVKKYLTKNGKILIVCSSLTKKKKVENIIKKYGFHFQLLGEKKLFFEVLYVYLIF